MGCANHEPCPNISTRKAYFFAVFFCKFAGIKKYSTLETNHTKHLTTLYKAHFNNEISSIKQLAASGSDRRYYRINSSSGNTCLGVYNPHIEENECFIYFAKHFGSKGLNTPKVYAQTEDTLYYLVEDFGDDSMHAYFNEANRNGEWNNQCRSLMVKSLEALAHLQIEGDKGLDYNKAFPIPSFDKRSIMWDLNYFKYALVKAKQISFNELALEKDFENFCNWLLKERPQGFHYRDFQSRNVMVKDNQPYFIDFQGGRKGPLQYDVVSFLYQISANVPAVLKSEMIEVYLNAINKYQAIDKEDFMQDLPGFVLFRLLQVLGAYGFRGLYENKPHFIKSLPPALDVLREYLESEEMPVEMPELKKVLQALCAPKKYNLPKDKLHIYITSFSFLKSGIPKDPSPNGGGHVFDCRFLPNPGRIDQYKQQNGMDQPVIDYLEEQKEVHQFLDSAYKILDAAVENYIERGFSNLMISFGCTGGQHRSVYSAESTFKHLINKYDVIITVDHIMQNHKYTSTNSETISN